ncbi:MAG TPA: TraB/GumN family protein [Caldimonas sp.]|nr:TraB/GumN family protein [Caldimonas sp.]
MTRSIARPPSTRVRSALAHVLALVALLLALSPLTFAQNAPQSCPPEPTPLDAARLERGMRTATDHGFLWRIRRDGRTSYLYGTIHIARAEWMFPGPRTMAALATSDTVALEIDMLDPDMQTRIAAALRRQSATALPAPLAERLERRFVAECIDAATMRTLAPEFQIATLTVLAARRDGLHPAYAIDTVLAGIARSLDKATVSLETPELQAATLQMSSAAETIEFVTAGLDELESGRARPLLVRLAKAWSTGDLAAIEGYESWCDCLNTAAEREAMKRMLDDRNPALADAIAKLHAGGETVFAAVGSLHMIGPNGLPALLARRGFSVEAVRFER